jgi:asparagine synthase (glutamine-hydrolysing)
MCGIFLYFIKDGIIRKEVMETLLLNYESFDYRGPDKHSLSFFGNCLAGFHRLAINDLSVNGDQPFELNEEFLMCNGEIYNYHELQSTHNFPLKSTSDCEILLHLFQKYGVRESLNLIDGVFAIVYITKKSIYMIRDRIGVKPLFFSESNENNSLAVSSEPIGLVNVNQLVMEVKPSTFIEYSKDNHMFDYNIYYSLPEKPLYFNNEEAIFKTKYLLVDAVRKRASGDRPIGCLLSGGLDSSIIASILTKYIGNKFKTFSVGFPDSIDLIYARKVANYLNTDHHELIIQYKDALRYIPYVIKRLGTYDTTTIRASTPMFMLCDWINKNFEEKIIFSGEGSDEIFCGYLYSHNAPTNEDLFDDSKRLVSELYKYDVLRADRCTSCNSLELREPFLDINLLDYVMKLSGELRKPKEYEKDLLRKAFEGYLPDEVLWRRKAAFSDAVSSSEKPWYKWIQEHVENIDIVNFTGTKESRYYKSIFASIYKNYKPLIPLWLPRWSHDSEEPSATVLNVYKKEEHI